MEYRFECQVNCGKCCMSEGEPGYLYLNESDCRNLAINFGIELDTFLEEYTEFTDGNLHLRGTGTCQFLEGTKCSIHEIRPTQCRTFPFWPDNIEPQKWNELSEKCPGIGKGKIYSQIEIEENLESARQILPD